MPPKRRPKPVDRYDDKNYDPAEEEAVRVEERRITADPGYVQKIKKKRAKEGLIIPEEVDKAGINWRHLHSDDAYDSWKIQEEADAAWNQSKATQQTDTGEPTGESQSQTQNSPTTTAPAPSAPTVPGWKAVATKLLRSQTNLLNQLVELKKANAALEERVNKLELPMKLAQLQQQFNMNRRSSSQSLASSGGSVRAIQPPTVLHSSLASSTTSIRAGAIPAASDTKELVEGLTLDDVFGPL